MAKFAPRHVVAIIASICAAVIMFPVAVMAAAQLVNISDPQSSARKARVGSNGTLMVESRSGVPSGAFHKNDPNNTTLSLRPLYEADAPKRIAVTEFTAGGRGSDNGFQTQISLRAYVRTSGTNPCGGAGWTPTTLADYILNTGDSHQFVYNGPPLLLPTPATGQRVCLAYLTSQLPSGVVVFASVTGFIFTP